MIQSKAAGLGIFIPLTGEMTGLHQLRLKKLNIVSSDNVIFGFHNPLT